MTSQNVIDLPYIADSSMSGSRLSLNSLLINVPQFAFTTLNFEHNYLYESEFNKRTEADKLASFVDRLNNCKGRLWSTLEMIKKIQFSGNSCSVYTHFKNTCGQIVHGGPWTIDQGDIVYALPPLEAKDLIDRRNGSPTTFKIHKNSNTTYVHPSIVSDRIFQEFKEEVVLMHCLDATERGNHVAVSTIGRIIGKHRMYSITLDTILKMKPIGLVKEKKGMSGSCANKVHVGDVMIIRWTNRH